MIFDDPIFTILILFYCYNKLASASDNSCPFDFIWFSYLYLGFNGKVHDCPNNSSWAI